VVKKLKNLNNLKYYLILDLLIFLFQALSVIQKFVKLIQDTKKVIHIDLLKMLVTLNMLRVILIVL